MTAPLIKLATMFCCDCDCHHCFKHSPVLQLSLPLSSSLLIKLLLSWTKKEVQLTIGFRSFGVQTWLLCYCQISLHHCLCIQAADRLIQLTNLQRRLEPKIKGEALIPLLDKLVFSFGFCISCFGSGGAKVLLRWKKENEAEWEASCVMCIAEVEGSVMCIAEVEGRKCGVLCRLLVLELGRS